MKNHIHPKGHPKVTSASPTSTPGNTATTIHEYQIWSYGENYFSDSCNKSPNKNSPARCALPKHPIRREPDIYTLSYKTNFPKHYLNANSGNPLYPHVTSSNKDNFQYTYSSNIEKLLTYSFISE